VGVLTRLAGLGETLALRVIAFGPFRRSPKGRLPEVEVHVDQLRDFNPRNWKAGTSCGVRSLWVPATELRCLPLFDYWWVPPGEAARRWTPNYRWTVAPMGNIQNVYVTLNPSTMAIVRGSDLTENGTPYVQGLGRDMAWLRVSDSYTPDDPKSPWRAWKSVTYIPCVEIVRYCFGLSILLTDAVTCRLLMRPDNFRYADISLDTGGCLFTKPKHRGSNDSEAETRPAPSLREEEYAYKALRQISWSIVSSTQQSRALAVEAVPPVEGRVNLRGTIITSRDDDRNRTDIVYRIDSMRLWSGMTNALDGPPAPGPETASRLQ